MMRGIEMPLGMRHQPQYAAGRVADTRHVGHRTVGVVGEGKVEAAVEHWVMSTEY